jgi:hypothetical protein
LDLGNGTVSLDENKTDHARFWKLSPGVADLVGLSDLPYDVLQRSTVAEIQAAGFIIRRTGKWPHCTIDLGVDADEDAAARLIAAFAPPEASPRTGDQS